MIVEQKCVFATFPSVIVHDYGAKPVSFCAVLQLPPWALHVPRGRRHGQEYPKLLGSLWVFAESSSYRHERYRCPEDGGMGKNTRSYWHLCRFCGVLQLPPLWTHWTLRVFQKNRALQQFYYGGHTSNGSTKSLDTEDGSLERWLCHNLRVQRLPGRGSGPDKQWFDRTALCNNFTTGAIRRMDHPSIFLQWIRPIPLTLNDRHRECAWYCSFLKFSILAKIRE